MSTDVPSLKSQLESLGIRADKKLGQHFLLDGNVTDKIVSFAGDLSQTHCVEIGPGPGGLTRSLAKASPASLQVIEADERFLPMLQTLPNVTVHHADALKLSPLTIAPAAPRAIIANLPYNVGTVMLVNWLHEIAEDAGCYDFIMVMLQKEVAERLVAEPNSKTYGRLSVLTQWLCHAEMLYYLPPSVFSPPPKVDSAVIRLIPRKNRLEASAKSLEAVVKAAFGQRRKMLRQSLKTLHSAPEDWLQSADIAPTKRAEALSIAEFVRLSRLR